MTEPIRITLGILDSAFDRAEEGRIINLAVAAVAAMAVVGNGDAHLIDPVLRSAVENYRGMSKEAQDQIGTMVEELIRCARERRPFIGLARFKSGD